MNTLRGVLVFIVFALLSVGVLVLLGAVALLWWAAVVGKR